MPSPAGQSAGRPLRQVSKGRRGGKSGLHGNTVPANGRRGRPQGKCHRKQTARRSPKRRNWVRVKGWGKSPPRDRQRDRHGKPHREQNRIGTARGASSRQVSRPAVRVGCSKRPATGAPEEWPSRGRKPAIQNPAYRPTGTLRRRRPETVGGVARSGATPPVRRAPPRWRVRPLSEPPVHHRSRRRSRDRRHPDNHGAERFRFR